ncbi:MAG: hypothetical protein ABF449_10985, partial [Ethanoligenens sp.]
VLSTSQTAWVSGATIYCVFQKGRQTATVEQGLPKHPALYAEMICKLKICTKIIYNIDAIWILCNAGRGSILKAQKGKGMI